MLLSSCFCLMQRTVWAPILGEATGRDLCLRSFRGFMTTSSRERACVACGLQLCPGPVFLQPGWLLVLQLPRVKEASASACDCPKDAFGHSDLGDHGFHRIMACPLTKRKQSILLDVLSFRFAGTCEVCNTKILPWTALARCHLKYQRVMTSVRRTASDWHVSGRLLAHDGLLSANFLDDKIYFGGPKSTLARVCLGRQLTRTA